MHATRSRLCRYFGCARRSHGEFALCIDHEMAYIADHCASTRDLPAGPYIEYATAEDSVYWWSIKRIRATNGGSSPAMVMLGVPEHEPSNN